MNIFKFCSILCTTSMIMTTSGANVLSDMRKDSKVISSGGAITVESQKEERTSIATTNAGIGVPVKVVTNAAIDYPTITEELRERERRNKVVTGSSIDSCISVEEKNEEREKCKKQEEDEAKYIFKGIAENNSSNKTFDQVFLETLDDAKKEAKSKVNYKYEKVIATSSECILNTTNYDQTRLNQLYQQETGGFADGTCTQVAVLSMIEYYNRNGYCRFRNTTNRSQKEWLDEFIELVDISYDLKIYNPDDGQEFATTGEKRLQYVYEGYLDAVIKIKE